MDQAHCRAGADRAAPVWHGDYAGHFSDWILNDNSGPAAKRAPFVLAETLPLRREEQETERALYDKICSALFYFAENWKYIRGEGGIFNHFI